jgi:hypothetical protein
MQKYLDQAISMQKFFGPHFMEFLDFWGCVVVNI